MEFEDHGISYQQLIDRSKSIANALLSRLYHYFSLIILLFCLTRDHRGTKLGDRILILTDYFASSLESIFGVILTGAIAAQVMKSRRKH